MGTRRPHMRRPSLQWSRDFHRGITARKNLFIKRGGPASMEPRFSSRNNAAWRLERRHPERWLQWSRDFHRGITSKTLIDWRKDKRTASMEPRFSSRNNVCAATGRRSSFLASMEPRFSSRNNSDTPVQAHRREIRFNGAAIFIAE